MPHLSMTVDKRGHLGTWEGYLAVFRTNGHVGRQGLQTAGMNREGQFGLE